MKINTETHLLEFPILYKEDRIWKIYIRLIKKSSKKIHNNIDWNLFEEIQVPIFESYISKNVLLPNDIISQYWTETGLINGKITRSIPTYPIEKNLSKKNYRNFLEQAIFEVKSKINKKISEGFSLENNLNSNLYQKIFPMLAKPYKSSIKFPVYCQPKLDGLRCICFLDYHTNEIIMQSRTKKDFPNNNLNIIIKNNVRKLLEYLPKGAYLDGELYNHNTTLQTLNHYIRDSHNTNDSFSLQYHIYDIIINFKDTFQERLKYFENIFENECIKLVKTKFINTKKELDDFYLECINNGFEGTMIRDPHFRYEMKRTDGLLKRKETFTEEYPIVGFTCGTKGKDLNAIIWICNTKENKEFKVMPNISYSERYDLYKKCVSNFEELYKNRLLMVEYRSLTIDNIPLHGKGIIIRDIE